MLAVSHEHCTYMLVHDFQTVSSLFCVCSPYFVRWGLSISYPLLPLVFLKYFDTLNHFCVRRIILYVD